MKRMKIFITLLAGMLCLPVVMHAQIKANKDSVAVAEYLQRANDGDAVAQNRVGLWYYTGVGGLDKDYTMAAKWWALAAQQGNSDAVGNLAMCYQLGNGVEADSTTAAKLYIRSIHDGNSRLLEQHERLATKGKLFSAMLLYDIYLHGKAGMAPDQEKAFTYLEIAARKSLTAKYKLAYLYENGIGTPADTAKARSLYEEVLNHPQWTGPEQEDK